MNDLFTMVRNPDHATSIRAASGVRRVTLRQQVIDFAKNCLAGFTDGDLKEAFPWTPESSMRKRRTELTQENIILDSGRTRQNRHGQQEIVWLHRFCHPCPPDVVDREHREGPTAKIARLEAEIASLKEARKMGDVLCAERIRLTCHSGDIEQDHATADNMIVDILRDLGWAETVAAWKAVRKWHA